MDRECELRCCDCLEWMKEQPDNSVDLVFGSPPYEAARTYGIGFKKRGQEWVDWMVERVAEMQRISRGLVAMVIEGQTRNFKWSATPVLLMADLHRAGFNLRKPPIFHRVGIPGSGGPDWLRNDFEFILCVSKGKLPWSDNVVMGHEPKWNPGGDPSHRMANGRRVHRLHTKADADGKRQQGYNPPAKANPGNVLHFKVGGGLLGSQLAHENEAPFPEKLAEFFVRSFCPPGGVVLDPFSGSATTGAAAIAHGRRYIGLDVRQDQIDLGWRRIAEAKERLLEAVPCDA